MGENRQGLLLGGGGSFFAGVYIGAHRHCGACVSLWPRHSFFYPFDTSFDSVPIVDQHGFAVLCGPSFLLLEGFPCSLGIYKKRTANQLLFLTCALNQPLGISSVGHFF